MLSLKKPFRKFSQEAYQNKLSLLSPTKMIQNSTFASSVLRKRHQEACPRCSILSNHLNSIYTILNRRERSERCLATIEEILPFLDGKTIEILKEYSVLSDVTEESLESEY